ncbi:MAG: twin-arginine translocation signal domain-containing protein, partial [Thermoguttaceae bacterium]
MTPKSTTVFRPSERLSRRDLLRGSACAAAGLLLGNRLSQQVHAAPPTPSPAPAKSVIQIWMWE